jgi:hypothetical protein
MTADGPQNAKIATLAKHCIKSRHGCNVIIAASKVRYRNAAPNAKDIVWWPVAWELNKLNRR